MLDKLKDKLSGVFGANDETEKEPINTPEQQKIVSMVLNDYEVFKSERQRYEGQWKQEQRFYRGDHWKHLRSDEVSKNRPNDKENICWSQTESITSKLCSWMPFPQFEAQEENDEQKAQDLNAYMPYELKQIRFQQKHIRAVRRMTIHGPLIYKVLYDPDVEGGSGQYKFDGQNDIVPVDLGSFFPDPRIRDFIDLQQGAAHLFHFRKPLEHFVERWGEQGKKVRTDMEDSDVNLYNQDDYSMRNFTADRSKGEGEETNKTAGLIEYWYRGKPKLMSKEDKEIFTMLAEEKLAVQKDPSEDMAKAKGTAKGIHCVYISKGGVFLEHKSYVYDHGQYPIVARTLFPDEDNPWGKGYMRDMIPPQIMLNKLGEIAIETMAKQGNSGVYHEPGAIAKIEKFRQQRALPGFVLEVNDITRIKEVEGINTPSTVFNMQQFYLDMLQKIPGQFDSANGQANTNVKSGEQAKALIGAANARLTISSALIEDALCEVFEQYISNMAQFYTTARIGRVTGKQVQMSRDQLVSLVPGQATIPDPTTGEEVDVAVNEEYIPKFDIAVKIGVDKPQDRDYWLQTAFNLLGTVDPLTQMPLIDGEAVRYTVENGRMENFDVIEERMGVEQRTQQQMMQLTQTVEQLTQQLQASQEQSQAAVDIAAESQMNNQNQQSEAQRMQREEAFRQSETEHKRNMDIQKLDLERQKIAMSGQRQ